MVVQARQEAVEGSGAVGSKIAFRPRGAAAAAGVSLSKIYLELRAGRLRARKMGGVTLILREDLETWLRGLPVKDRVSVAHQDRMRAQWKQRRATEAAAARA